MTMVKISLFVMSRKGYVVIRDLTQNGFARLIDKVVIAHDPNMQKDYYEEILSECQNAKLNVYDRKDNYYIDSQYVMTISWRWMVPLDEKSKLIVFHDSLLPKYRGFAPLVNMLINHEPYIGVTALYASGEYDKGDIIDQRKVEVKYPIKITDAIDLVTPLYSEIICEIFDKVASNQPILSKPQNEEYSSYSLWRDEEDYEIDWTLSSERILQFIYSVGFPFKGASSSIGDEKIRIIEGELRPDVQIESRQPGKVIFMENGYPIVVCGKGLMKIKSAVYESGESALPLKKFRVRFK